MDFKSCVKPSGSQIQYSGHPFQNVGDVSLIYTLADELSQMFEGGPEDWIWEPLL